MPSIPISGQSFPSAAGMAVRARDLNRMGDASFQNSQFPGSSGGRFPGGTIINPSTATGGGSAKTIFPAWYPFFTTNSGTTYANFFTGTVGGILPSNIFTPVALTASVVNYLWLACTATAGLITAATITTGTTYPTLAASTSAAAPTSFNIPIAIADLTGAKPLIFNIVGFGNIWCQPYVTVFDTINTGALLTAPFTPWFNWEWGAGN